MRPAKIHPLTHARRLTAVIVKPVLLMFFARIVSLEDK